MNFVNYCNSIEKRFIPNQKNVSKTSRGWRAVSRGHKTGARDYQVRKKCVLTSVLKQFILHLFLRPQYAILLGRKAYFYGLCLWLRNCNFQHEFDKTESHKNSVIGSKLWILVIFRSPWSTCLTNKKGLSPAYTLFSLRKPLYHAGFARIKWEVKDSRQNWILKLWTHSGKATLAPKESNSTSPQRDRSVVPYAVLSKLITNKVAARRSARIFHAQSDFHYHMITLA